MNTLESMRARQARHRQDAAWHARARASAELADQHHRTESPSTENTRRRQAATKEAATKNRQRWTKAELEVALDPSLSSRAVAFQLGRTLYSVRTIRKKHGLALRGDNTA